MDLCSFMESRLKLLSRTSLRLSEFWSHMWWKYVPARSKFRRIYHTYWEKNVSNVKFVDKCWKPYIISHTCDPDWMMGEGVRGWGGIMFLPVLAPLPDTLYNHCFLRIVLIKMTLKLSQSLVAKSSGQLATERNRQNDVIVRSVWVRPQFENETQK